MVHTWSEMYRYTKLRIHCDIRAHYVSSCGSRCFNRQILSYIRLPFSKSVLCQSISLCKDILPYESLLISSSSPFFMSRRRHDSSSLFSYSADFSKRTDSSCSILLHLEDRFFSLRKERTFAIGIISTKSSSFLLTFSYLGVEHLKIELNLYHPYSGANSKTSSFTDGFCTCASKYFHMLVHGA